MLIFFFFFLWKWPSKSVNVFLFERFFKSSTLEFLLTWFRRFSKLSLNFSSKKRKFLSFLFFLLWEVRSLVRNKIFWYLNKFAKISLIYDKIRDFVVLFNSFFAFVSFVIFEKTKYNLAEFIMIIVNYFNAFALTIFKIFRIFGKKISRSFVKSLDKQKNLAFAFVRVARFA